MDRVLYLAMNGAKQSLYRQELTSHNLSNASTNGYKSQSVAFKALPVIGPGLATRTFSVETTPGADLSSGVLHATGRSQDIAVHGRGWIAVQDDKGNEAYTRDGSLQVDPNGILTTANGRTVLGDGGPITVPENSEYTVGKDGTVTVVSSGQYNALSTIGRIKLVNPEDSQLVRGDDGLFRQKNGQPAEADASVVLATGMLESSNVNAVDSLVNIIEQSRFFDTQMQLMKKADENESSTLKLLSLTA